LSQDSALTRWGVYRAFPDLAAFDGPILLREGKGKRCYAPPPWKIPSYATDLAYCQTQTVSSIFSFFKIQKKVMKRLVIIATHILYVSYALTFYVVFIMMFGKIVYI